MTEENKKPQNNLYAMPKTFMQPWVGGQTWFGHKGRIKSFSDFMGSRQVHWVDGNSLNLGQTLGRKLCILLVEGRSFNRSSGKEVFGTSTLGNFHQGMPEKRQVAERRPYRQWQKKGAKGNDSSSLGGDFAPYSKPIHQVLRVVPRKKDLKGINEA
jgi:hypothetical protein